MGLVSAHAPTAADPTIWQTRLASVTCVADVHADLRAGDKDFVLLDARDETAFVRAHLPGAQHLPPAAIDEHTATHFLPDRARLVVCYGEDGACLDGEKAAAALAELGYRVKVLLGGIAAWRATHRIEGAEA